MGAAEQQQEEWCGEAHGDLPRRDARRADVARRVGLAYCIVTVPGGNGAGTPRGRSSAPGGALPLGRPSPKYREGPLGNQRLDDRERHCQLLGHALEGNQSWRGHGWNTRVRLGGLDDPGRDTTLRQIATG